MRPWVRVLRDVAGAVVVGAIVLIAAASDDRRSTRRTRATKPPPRQLPVAKLPPDPTLEVYCAAMRSDGGQDAILLLGRGIEWVEQWNGWIEFGKGPHAPLYLVIPDRDDEPVKVLSFDTAGETGVLYRWLKHRPPFDEEGERRDLTLRLNQIQGIYIPPGRWNGRARNVRLDVMRSLARREAFFGIYDDVAQRLQAPGS